MHRVPLCVAFALTAALSSSAPAAVPYRATVAVPEAEVRCGASNGSQMYVTNKLRKGDAVEVVEERPDGWLAIRPPRGSFSWIDTRYVQRIVPNQPTWRVENAPNVRNPVPVLIGSAVVNARPTVEGVRVPRGTQVRSVGQPERDGDGQLLPIEPPEGEVRFIRSEAVTHATQTAAAPTTSVAARSPERNWTTPATAPPPSVGTDAGKLVASPAGSTDTDPRWTQAQQAERAGNLAEAVRLYDQMAREFASTRNDLSLQAMNRASWLRESSRPAPATTSAPRPAPTTSDGRVYPPAESPGSRQPDAAGTRSTGPGYLRRSGVVVDGRPTYVLETSDGRPRYYVTAGAGVDLAPYLNRPVELFGTTDYRGTIRAWHMSVSRVQPLQ